MKKYLVVVFGIAVMIGGTLIAQEYIFQKENNVVDNILKEVNLSNNVYELKYSASYMFEYKDPEQMYDNHDFIAFIHVDKLHPATTYRQKTDEYIMPYTPGEATILKVLKGDFESQKITFLRLGGIVSYADYEKSLYPSAREKFTKMFDENKKATTYINSMNKDDINIECDKTYLVYMNRSDDFHNENEYTIEAFEFGLREVNTNNNTLSVNSSKITIKNNETGEYEKLEDAVSEEIFQKWI